MRGFEFKIQVGLGFRGLGSGAIQGYLCEHNKKSRMSVCRVKRRTLSQPCNRPSMFGEYWTPQTKDTRPEHSKGVSAFCRSGMNARRVIRPHP